MTAPPSSPLRISLRRFRRNKMALGCVALLGAFTIACVVGPWVARVTYSELDTAHGFQRPSPRHWVGTDQYGRDVLVRALVGGRISLAVGLVGTLVSVVIGVGYGAVAGYCGGWVDSAMMRLVDVLYGLPYMLFVVLIMACLGTRVGAAERILAMFVALGAVQWLTTAIIVRGEVRALREKEFVEAARAAGARHGRILFRHILPNLAGVVIVYSTLTVPQVMLQEAFLSFLGLGVPQPMPSWGALICDGAAVLETQPHLVLFPGAMFTAVLFALNFVGDGLRDALDPQMRV